MRAVACKCRRSAATIRVIRKSFAGRIQSAQSAGIDRFVVNWYGRNSVRRTSSRSISSMSFEQWNRKNPERPFFSATVSRRAGAGLPEANKAVAARGGFRLCADHLIPDSCLLREYQPVFLCFS